MQQSEVMSRGLIIFLIASETDEVEAIAERSENNSEDNFEDLGGEED
jgi:hypothetical protein